MKKLLKILFVILTAFVALIVLTIIYFNIFFSISNPNIHQTKILSKDLYKVSDNFYKLGNNWIKKNDAGLWEMYIEGTPYQRGLAIGYLSKDLIQSQEKAFIDGINQLIPSKFYLNFLKYFVAWFNRDIESYIKEEYRYEIYGISQSASKDYDYIGTNYERILNYHAAHDIGHALQNLHLVGCTSFATWGDASKDGELIIGRNFDFYFGDEFSKNKIVSFYNPDKGNKFMIITWGGMIGAVSGMNEKGLTVTINAAKSDIPTQAKTPITIVTREILQYAKNIEQALEIAKKHVTFVSESILIGSKEDKKAVIIEKTPQKTVMFSNNSNYIICTNHFQSPEFKYDKLNNDSYYETSSHYRYDRVNELIEKYKPLDPLKAALILRDQKGFNDKNIGLGNEKSINQLIAHHSVVFCPESLMVWVSTEPYQLGEFVAYDLNKVFNEYKNLNEDKDITEDELNIPSDNFLVSADYKKYLNYRKLKSEFKLASKYNLKMQGNQIDSIILSNPDYYETYLMVADYYYNSKDYENASKYYKLALTKETSSMLEYKNIKEKLDFSIKNLNEKKSKR